jgi:hypothetical protein
MEPSFAGVGNGNDSFPRRPALQERNHEQERRTALLPITMPANILANIRRA